MRKKTLQEIRNEAPDRPIKSAKKKVHKPFVVQYRWLGPTNPPDQFFEILGVWHGDHKFATMELAEAYVAKQKRASYMARYEFRIVPKGT
jgi:hypothetical protein